MKKNLFVIYISFLLIPLFCFSINKEDLKEINNWPLKMDSSNSFDTASKCEMLVFIEVFNQYDSLSKNTLSKKINVKNINYNSINEWKKRTKIRIINNFKRLNNESLKAVIPIKTNKSWQALSSINLEKQIPNNFLQWYKKTKLFYTNYIKEQLYLAALHPKITSEILQFSANEISGHNFLDKNFLLTFDDGPTNVNGNTDKIIKVLSNHKLTGVFFVLGKNLERRLKKTSIKSIKNLYKKNLVFSHGEIHKSHQNYKFWKESINYTNSLIHKIFPLKNKNELVYFRPPYGQRNKDLVNYFTLKKSKIIYWNIDSRDWSSKLNRKQVAYRQIKLMLLWRNGILLFHDIHPKVQAVIPIIYNYFKDTNITWMKSF